ncbi:6-phospho-beta-glucosidase [Anaerocolumna jejuensis DSM 15929]|uniref:6-phospho-beta-glucosidase n=1 Tax=Anaerocolumna jejuensis DSM 15929 TaxID=1121322 RepID=A0A1M6Z9Y8_9FIRM|nr:6-phospho-beta-glucosidase [Anaerocolumna jejuensis]SHL27296.1 6-phospho-beta-glucosidase [Anaerocolumna jejuensis DSM 15929]
MKNLKIAVIGAGSTYTPELMNGFITRNKHLKVDSFYMMDIDKEKTEIVTGLGKRMLEANGMNSRVIITDKVEEAVEGADYVLGQIRVGKLDARIRDEKIPLKYDLLGQETTGAGGFMKALRTIPVMMDIAKTIERLSPNAWFINFSNPSGIIAEVLLNNSDVKMLGLCNAPINMLRRAKEMLPENTKKFDYDFVGLNHLFWLTALYADDKEILQNLFLGGYKNNSLKNIPEVVYEEELLKAIKGLPVSYLNYYYFRDKMVKKCKEAEMTRGEECKLIEAELLELYKDTNLKEKPAVLDKRGGALYSEAAVSVVDAIENDRNEVHVVDVKNNGALSFMDKDDVIEAKCIINKDGATPLKLNDFNNEHIIGLMQAVKAFEKLTVKAGIEGDYNAALGALLTHPLIGDYYKAKSVLDEMLEANKEFLPQFFGGK